MAIILMEEVLMGLGEVKDALDHAVMVLEDLTDDLAPDLGENLKETLDTTLLRPLQSRSAVVDELLNDLATLA